MGYVGGLKRPPHGSYTGRINTGAKGWDAARVQTSCAIAAEHSQRKKRQDGCEDTKWQ